MISPKYRELDKEKLAKEEKYAKKHVKSAFLNNPVGTICIKFI